MDHMRITEKTSISLFAVIISFPFFVSVVLWAAGINERALANEARVLKVEHKQDEQTNLLMEIRDRLIRMEERINKH